MELIPISEFLRLTLLSEAELLSMLEHGELITSLGAQGELLIDISNVDEKLIATRTAYAALGFNEQERELYEEVIAGEILLAVDGIIDEALTLAGKWQHAKTDDSERD